MLQERILALGNGRLLALTLDGGMDHSPPTRRIAQAYAFLNTHADRKECFALVTEPLPADPKQAADLEKQARGQDQVAAMYRGKKMEAQYLENAAKHREAAKEALVDSRMLPREAWPLDEKRVLLGYQLPMQPRWFRVVDVDAGQELERFSVPDLLPAMEGIAAPKVTSKSAFDPILSKTRVQCAQGDLLLVNAVFSRKLLKRVGAGWVRLAEIGHAYHGVSAPVAGGFALDSQPETDKHEVVHADASGELKARWPRKKQFAVTMSGTTPPSSVSAFGHLGGEIFVADAASGEIDAVPPLLGLGKEDLATPRLSPSSRYVATFKHYGGDRISVFDRNTRLVAALPLPSASKKRAPANGGDAVQMLWADMHLEEDSLFVLAGGEIIRTPLDSLSWGAPPPPPPKFKKLGTPKETIEAAVQKGPLAPIAGLVRGLYAASVALAPTPQKRELPVGQSKFNGLPDLPAGVDWPRWRDVPMAFLAQVDLAEAHAVAPDLSLPSTGLLSFFLGLDPEYPLPSFFGEVNTDAGGARVLYTPAGTPLERKARPKDMPGAVDPAAEPVCKLKFARAGAVLPQLSHSALQLAALTPEQAIAYEALADLVNGKDDDAKQWGTRLGGYPAVLQNDDLHLEAQSRQVGGDDADSKKYALWQQPEFQQAALDWRQLLQMDEGAQGWGWGDAGLMHWMARRDELATADFSTVWTIGVCH